MTIQTEKSKSQKGAATTSQARKIFPAIMAGMAHRCPACGYATLYSGYLKIAHSCSSCDESLHHHRADDAPPYLTIFIVGHLIVAGVLKLEQAYEPEVWVHIAIWTPLTLLLSLLLLPRIKGGLVGLQWALRMHGFAGDAEQIKENASQIDKT